MSSLNLHSLSNVVGSRKPKMRVGCGMGSGKGKTCGRGHKGQYARSGHKHKPGFEGGQMRLLRRIPKRGFVNSLGRRFAVLNLSAFERFADGAEISPEILREEGILKSKDDLKILGSTELKKKFTVKAHAFSRAARQSIEAAGGKCIVLD